MASYRLSVNTENTYYPIRESITDGFYHTLGFKIYNKIVILSYRIVIYYKKA